MTVDDYNALSKINTLVKSDKIFEKKLLELHLSAINEYEDILGFDSNQLSEKVRNLLDTLTKVELRQIKFLFKEIPITYPNDSKIKFLKDDDIEYQMFIESATRDDLISTIENEAKMKVDSFVASAVSITTLF